jgi:hypothetical protein
MARSRIPILGAAGSTGGLRGARFRVSARAARAAGHPELAGRVVRRVREGGTTRYVGVHGELRGRSFSRSLMERVHRIGSNLEVTASEDRARRVRRLQEEYGLSYKQAVEIDRGRHRMAHDDHVNALMERTGMSRNQAEKEVREAERVLRQSDEWIQQHDEERTRAHHALGTIGADEYYKDGQLVTAGMAAA